MNQVNWSDIKAEAIKYASDICEFDPEDKKQDNEYLLATAFMCGAGYVNKIYIDKPAPDAHVVREDETK